jgi:import inner membrane translocase subunit TIM16
MTAEGLKQASKVKKNQISLQEAQQILGVGESATWEEIMERYKKMFEANEKNGSFYLQSKIYRAHERLRDEYKVEDGADQDAGRDAGHDAGHDASGEGKA